MHLQVCRNDGNRSGEKNTPILLPSSTWGVGKQHVRLQVQGAPAVGGTWAISRRTSSTGDHPLDLAHLTRMIEPPPLSLRSSESGEPYTCTTRQPAAPPLPAAVPPLLLVAPGGAARLAGSMRSSRSNT